MQVSTSWVLCKIQLAYSTRKGKRELTGMIRVLHLVDSLGIGGAERQLALIVAALDHTRFQSHVCHLHSPSHLGSLFTQAGVPVYGLEVSGKHQWPIGIIKLLRLVHSLKIDLIHTSLFESDILGGVCGRLSGIPVVSTLCNIGGEPERLIDNPRMNRLKLSFTTKFWGYTLRLGHRHYIAISKAVMDSAVRTYKLPEHKITVIYRTLSSDWFDDDSSVYGVKLREELDINGAYPVVVNVGRLVPQKGQRYLIEAMPEVLIRFPQGRVLIAGEGILHDSLAKLCQELGIQDNVEFLGARDDVRELLAISNIFVFPSLFEGLGGALLEAAGMGKPCVASRVGPLPEVIEHGVSGLLVPSRNPQAIAQAIIGLAGDPERARTMGDNARAIVRSRFAISRIATELEQLYVRVLALDERQNVPANPPNR